MAEITLGTINNTLTQVESNTETTSRGIGSFIDYLKGKEDRDLEALREAKNQQTKIAPEAGGNTPPPSTKSGGFGLGGIGKVLAGLSLAKLAPMIGKKLLTRVLGPIAIATFADDIVEYLLPEGFENQTIKDALAGGLQGGAIGFMVGGPLGAAIGAGIGALMKNENFKKAVTELGETLKVQGEALLKEIKPTVIRFKDAFINLFKSLGITPEGVTEGIAKTLNAIGNAAASGVESLTKIASGEFSGMDLVKGIGFLGTVAAVLMPGKFMKLFGMLAMMAKGGVGKTLRGVLAGGGAMLGSAMTMLGMGGGSKDMVTAKSGKQYHKDSPQGKMIQNMTKTTKPTSGGGGTAASQMSKSVSKFPILSKLIKIGSKIPGLATAGALIQLATMNPVTVDGVAGILGGLGGGTLGALAGGFVGTLAGGPLAAATGPLGALVGGVGGYVFGEAISQGLAQLALGKKVTAFPEYINDLLNGKSSASTPPAGSGGMKMGGGGPPNRTFVSPSTSGANIKNQVSGSGMSPGAMGGSNVSFSADTNQTINNSNTTQALISNGPSVDLQDQMTAGLT